MHDSVKADRGTFLATVLGNDRICDEHYRMVLALESFPPARAGQFVQVLCHVPDSRPTRRVVEWREDRPPKFSQPELAGRIPLLRRPFSLADSRQSSDGGAELTLIYRLVGTGTHWLATVQTGDSLSVLGPLGNHFTPYEDRPLAAVVGGGVGIPPMLYAARMLVAAGRETVGFVGARTASLVPLELTDPASVSAGGEPTHCAREFDARDARAAIATDDGSLGAPGPVTGPLTTWLDSLDDAHSDAAVYACGPEPMMRAVADICARRRVACQLSLERHMACGMGTCQSCICKIRADNERGWEFRLCCKDGPVFDAADVIWG